MILRCCRCISSPYFSAYCPESRLRLLSNIAAGDCGLRSPSGDSPPEVLQADSLPKDVGKLGEEGMLDVSIDCGEVPTTPCVLCKVKACKAFKLLLTGKPSIEEYERRCSSNRTGPTHSGRSSVGGETANIVGRAALLVASSLFSSPVCLLRIQQATSSI